MFKVGFVSHIKVKLSGFTVAVVHKKNAVSGQFFWSYFLGL